MALGRWAHPDDLLEDLSIQQLHGWAEYESMEPFGAMEVDLQFAATRRLMAIAAGGKSIGDLNAFRLHPAQRQRRNPEDVLAEFDRVTAKAERKPKTP